MNANFVSSFLHLDLNDDGVEEPFHCRSPQGFKRWTSSSTQRNATQRIQNYAARVILCLPKSSSIAIHIKSLHWFPVKVRSTYKIACLCYHCHSSTAPSYVTDMLHKKPLHTRNTRSSSYTMPLLNRPAHSMATLGDRSFSFASSSVWNSIPNDVRCAPSLLSFKSRLKTYLFRSVYKDWTVSLITVHVCMVWPCYCFVDGLS